MAFAHARHAGAEEDGGGDVVEGDGFAAFAVAFAFEGEHACDDEK